MSELPKYYTLLFSAVEEALAAIDAQNYGQAKELLIRGQQDAEDAYLDED